MDQALDGGDALRLYAIIEDCCDMWDDPSAWQHHLVASCERWVEGFSGWMQLFRTDDHGMQAPVSLAFGKAIEARVKQSFIAAARAGAAVQMPGLRGALPVGGWRTARCAELVTPEEYASSSFFRTFVQPVSGDDVLFGLARSSSDVCALLGVCRDAGAAPFSRRDRAAMSTLVRAVVSRVGSRLSTREHKGRHGLSPRERATLDGLLAGDSEKQVASRLGIREATAHDYVKALYRYFRVNSRGELMAYFIRRKPLALSDGRGSASSTDSSAGERRQHL